MSKKGIFTVLFLVSGLIGTKVYSCSILFYVDPQTGKIFVANNEDYWYDVEAYIQINPKSKKKLARLWYGWDNFAQGGINEIGLFFDAAVTPKQNIPEGFNNPNGRNVGDDILAYCSDIHKAITYLDKQKIAVSEGNMMFGDAIGNAVVVEWVNGEKKIIEMKENFLIATNFLLSDTSAGNYQCPRYQAIMQRIYELSNSNTDVDLKSIGNIIGASAQIPRKDISGRTGGTLYSSFINISDMEFVLVSKLDNQKVTKLNLADEFTRKKAKKIKLN